MSFGPSDYLGGRLQGLFRDSENGLIFGVCAGIADYFDCSLLLVRAIAVGALMIFTIPTGLIYLVAALLLRDRPLYPRVWSRERDFWRRGDDATGGGL